MATHALVVGGGFAGLEAAIQLRKAGLDVTLVSDRPYLWIYPTSIWVVTGERAFEDVCLDLADVARRHGFTFRQGKVESISGGAPRGRRGRRGAGGRPPGARHRGHAARAEGRRAHLRPVGRSGERRRGCTTRSRSSCAAGGGRIAMGFGGNPKDPSAVRGGPVFEVMFNVVHMLRKRGHPGQLPAGLLRADAEPRRAHGQEGRRGHPEDARRDGRGDALREEDRPASSRAARCVFEDGSRLPSDLTVFIPAQGGHPVFAASDLPRNEAGFVQIDAGCAVPGFPGVWAVGDSAALDGPPWRAKQGHLAEVMARVAASNVAAEVAGRPERESYLPHVSITCLMDMGNGAAYVHRDATKEQMIPLPVVGHWMKKGWGAYFKASKRKQVPRLPGM